ncbi:nephrin-like [Schistocerca serialis cubense]|uniref:nephrin-like n=1 Tax=Schistocerca serialis cubense TaxID=2023355 RepID=UPI00214E0899|nr:nephrin-like [Schistocerca serialis cubense]
MVKPVTPYATFLLTIGALTMFASAKDIPLIDVTVVAGESARLPCNISTSDIGDTVLLVLWYREDLGTPIYSVDARERDFSQAELWSDERELGRRAYFVRSGQTAALALDQTLPRDQATYRCRVDFRIAQTRNTRVNLTVIEPPTHLVIQDEAGNNRTSVVGPYTEGDSPFLYCDVYGGRPRPTVEWYRDDRLVTNKSVQVPGGQLRAEMALRALGRQDLRSSLRCRAYNNHRRPALESTVVVDMNLRPLDVRLLGVGQPLSAGRRYDLLCQSSGSRPPAKITWWLDGARLDGSKETLSADGNTTTSTLSFAASVDDADKRLACRAENSAVSSEALEDGARLQIHYVPVTTLKLGTSLRPESIREGSDVYFDCHVKAQPPVTRVEWRHNGRPLGPSASRGAGVILSNQSLVLQSVGRASGGNYSCVGVNSEGAGESKPFHLDVLYAPTCKPNQSRVIGVAKNERANISCEVEANPADVSFQWAFNNSADSQDVAPSRISLAGSVSYVTYTPVTELDYGTLLCWARNRVGRQRSPCVFHIVAAGRPDPVHNCSVVNASTDSLSVRCSEGFNGGLPQSFQIEVREAQSQHLRANVSSATPAFNVGGLRPGERYQASVYAHNPKGRSDPFVITAATVPAPERQLTASHQERPRGSLLTPALSVVAGVAAALLVVSLVTATLVRMLCRRRARRQRQRRKRNDAADAQAAPSPDKSAALPAAAAIAAKGDPAAAVVAAALGGPGYDGDDKNPDVIPQPAAVEHDEHADFLASCHQNISTIEGSSTGVMSPSRGRLQKQPQRAVTGPGPGGGGPYGSYCTLRNGLPLRELAPVSPPMMHSGVEQDLHTSAQTTGASLEHVGTPVGVIAHMSSATLPRHWQSPGAVPAPASSVVATPAGYPVPPRRHLYSSPVHLLTSEQLTAAGPVANKRESTV